MIVLDTDHLSEITSPHRSGHARLHARMGVSDDKDFAVPIVAAEEQLGGWLAKIHNLPQGHQQVASYARLEQLLVFLGHFKLLPFGGRAADEFERLRHAKIRVGTMDLKIASIVLAHGALLLSRNLRDFRRIPGLRVENWLDEAPPGQS